MSRSHRRSASFPIFRVTSSLLLGGFFLVVVVFWVRSYFYADGGVLKILPSEYIQVSAGVGRMCVWFEHKPIDKMFDWWSRPITEHEYPAADDRIPCFHLAFWPTFARLYLAHWLLAVVVGFLAIAPWCPRRFSVRSLLVAVTIVAVITAGIAWVDSSF